MLTQKQLDLLDFIHKRVERDGVPPSFDEMKDALDLRSKSGIHRLITALEERGFIRRLPHRARAIEVTRLPDAINRKISGRQRPAKSDLRTSKATSKLSQVPLRGRIAAGVPIEAIRESEHHVAVPDQMLRGNGSHFALEVKGDSMIDAGINHGDIVVIRESATADTGEIVVALIDDAEATLKRFSRQGNLIALEAANPAYETRTFSEDRVRIQGRLVGLIRTY